MIERAAPTAAPMPSMRLILTQISVLPVGQELRAAICALAVAPEQEDFVASNAESMEEADEWLECVPLALHADGELVGFAMYALDPDDGNYWIYRLMIDARYQRRGLGRAALAALVKLITNLHGCSRIILGVNTDNHDAARLYRSFGFVDTGEVIDGEIVMAFAVPTP
ncbi:GNAT family N-acetyltransferase [Labrys neptuniae]